jgi:hypothetical protein
MNFIGVHIAVLVISILCAASKNCRDLENEQEKHKFYPLRHCQRSNKTVIALTDVESAKECAQFARSVRGLAFNYSPRGRREKNLFVVDKNGTDDLSNCEVMACPEYRNYSNIVNDTRFDYYSLYAYPARELLS